MSPDLLIALEEKMGGDLTAMANSVTTQADFLRFVKALLADWGAAEAPGESHTTPTFVGVDAWEHDTIDGFLSAMIRWMEDTDHSRRYEALPDWKLFAFALLAGSRYE